MQRLEGRTAVVTGAASGIGRATAGAFARAGMRVVLADIEEPRLREAEAELSAAGHEVLGVRTDVSRWDDVQRLADRALERFGAVHVLHNNAGVVVSGPVEALTLSDWEWVLGVDLWSVIYGVKAFVPILKQQDEGHVINTASTAGFYATPVIAPYNVAKFGVVALTETLERELRAERANVAASVLCPGAVDTRIVESERNRPPESARDHAPSAQEEAFRKDAAALLGTRGLPPERVADLVVDAVRSKRFWVLTHPGWLDVLRERVEGMTRGELTSGFGG